MVVALLALVLALGSTASAGVPARIVRLISGSRIAPHSIQGNRLKNDTLTGRQVQESALGEVPRAKVAETAASATTAADAANAANATHAATATDATNAVNATNAITAASAANAANAVHAASADTAANASQLGGLGPSGYVAASKLVRYSAAMEMGDPDRTIATLGPLTFTASCTSDAGSTHAVLSARASTDVWLLGNTLNSGDSAIVQQLDTSAPDQDFLPIVRATDAAQSAAIEGVPILAVNMLGKDCRFFGTLVDDAG
jgi:hypothetical protein